VVSISAEGGSGSFRHSRAGRAASPVHGGRVPWWRSLPRRAVGSPPWGSGGGVHPRGRGLGGGVFLGGRWGVLPRTHFLRQNIE
jgi:hypothetical protein